MFRGSALKFMQLLHRTGRFNGATGFRNPARWGLGFGIAGAGWGIFIAIDQKYPSSMTMISVITYAGVFALMGQLGKRLSNVQLGRVQPQQREASDGSECHTGGNGERDLEQGTVDHHAAAGDHVLHEQTAKRLRRFGRELLVLPQRFGDGLQRGIDDSQVRMDEQTRWSSVSHGGSVLVPLSGCYQ